MAESIKFRDRRTVRVILVGPSLSSIGGQAVQAQLLREHWQRDAAVEVRFVPIDPPFPPWLSWVKGIRFARTLVRMLIYLPELWRAVDWADVVQVFSASYWSFLLAPVPALVVGRLRRKKVILNYHSGEARDHLGRWRTALLFLRKADQLVVPSGYLAAVFREFGLAAKIIPNLIDFERFVYQPHRPLRPHLLCTRNFEPYYGVDVVIRAFCEIKRRFPHATLCLVGSGNLEPALRRLTRDLGVADVQFAGAVAHDQIARFYEEESILINGSWLDNQPISILEAFASGLPVVTTAPEGIEYLVEHERTGLLSQVGDPEALAKNVLRLLNNPPLAETLAQNAYAASVRHQWAAVRELWLQTYRLILIGREAPPLKEEAHTKDTAEPPATSTRKLAGSQMGARGVTFGGYDILCSDSSEKSKGSE